MRRKALPSACGMSPPRNSSNLSSSFACMVSQLLRNCKEATEARPRAKLLTTSSDALVMRAQELQTPLLAQPTSC